MYQLHWFTVYPGFRQEGEIKRIESAWLGEHLKYRNLYRKGYHELKLQTRVVSAGNMESEVY